MVKPLHSDHLKLILILITGLIIYALVHFGCNRDNIPWQLDFKYSRYLTVMAPEYEKMTGFQSVNTVDDIRIYKVISERYHWYSLRELFSKKMIFETKDKSFIKKLILAAQKRSDADAGDLNGCNRVYKNHKFDQLYVVMLDNKSKRAGYFLVTICKIKNKEYMEVSVPDESGFGPIVYHTEALIPMLRGQ